jgi:hypothetical protein
LNDAQVALHYGHGVPVRRLPAILLETTGVTMTQGAQTRDARGVLSVSVATKLVVGLAEGEGVPLIVPLLKVNPGRIACKA